MSSPVIAGPPGECCVEYVKHEGTPVGKTIKIGSLDTYISEPAKVSKKIVLFLADIYGPFFLNNQLLQDYFASNGYLVLGPDYFEGDLFNKHTNEPGWELWDWLPGCLERARAVWPAWLSAIAEKYPPSEYTFFAAAYCFGAPFAMEEEIFNAVAIAHPVYLHEDHFIKLKKPVLFSCAEYDVAFTRENRHRAEDLLVEHKKVYHFEVFSGTRHGFAIRGDLENTRWAKEKSAHSFLEWFQRFD